MTSSQQTSSSPSPPRRPLARLLIIGSDAEQLAEALSAHSGELLEVERARLPAQGIRLFERTPPDALLLIARQGDALRALTRALLSRPLGQLVPILAMSPRQESVASPEELAAELGASAWFALDASPYELLHALAEHLDLDELISAPPLPHAPPPLPERAPQPESTSSQETASAREENSPEPRSPNTLSAATLSGAHSAVSQIDRASLFPARRAAGREGELTEEMVRRKLREVRHEDYFTILEVRRGAETPVIKDAFMRVMARYDGARIDFEMLHQFHQEIAEIRDAIEDAWAVLGDTDLRRRYLAAAGAGKV